MPRCHVCHELVRPEDDFYRDEWGRFVHARGDQEMTYGLDPQDGTNEGYDDARFSGSRARTEPPKYDSRDELSERRDRLEREAARLSDRIKMLDNLPEEPELADGEPVVICFSRTFSKRGAKLYDYAAIKAGDGLWYTTGPRTPKGYKWPEFIQWVHDNGPVEVWIATGYDAL